MAWSTPPTFTVGQILTAAQQNTISNNLVALGPGGWYRKTTAKAVNTTTTATDLLNGEITIAAGVMGATGILRMTAFGDWKQNAGVAAPPPEFQVVFGGTTIFDTGNSGSSFTNAATRYGWKIVTEILNTAAGAQVANFWAHVSGSVSANGQAAFTTGEGTYLSYTGSALGYALAGGHNAASVDTTAACSLALNVINGSSSSSYETKLFGAVAAIS